ncbi:hypothetical protein GBO17_06255 [Mycobacterium avium subsp. hominissuis]|uniref:hypothetical protein n=1 Tax=Mycobacterium avium TaxID=1764 RepID=UPI001CC4D1A3|nr:hypothetical protein [Mycobacterium avium]MBZ4557712.1 hypothetical protein [Mycobacterium avium subsp. hominissuis]MBZ4568088.1 hypothetical protein [Mycobacterium avium subsp. hominissuis]MBZ4586502.1 hypothetical protein [Mycobacterium avium subsp. hominissuis]MBZ4623487.1 hypothetical protein [Mycobacterium avium subsp. hominissuis]
MVLLNGKSGGMGRHAIARLLCALGVYPVTLLMPPADAKSAPADRPKSPDSVRISPLNNCGTG